MDKLNFHSQVKGEIPTSRFQKLLDELQCLEQFVPSDATVKVEIERLPDAWQVNLSVRHGRGHIATIGEDQDFDIASRKAIDWLFKKIHLWRELRNIEAFHLDSTTEMDSFQLFEAGSEQGDFRDMNILVVEDDPAAARVIEAMFRKSGCHVQSTQSATQAICEMRDKKYNLVVLDWNLPYLSGAEILREADKGDVNTATPVIICSSLNRERIEFPQLHHFYAFDYWDKAVPFSSSLQSVLSSLKRLRQEPVIT